MYSSLLGEQRISLSGAMHCAWDFRCHDCHIAMAQTEIRQPVAEQNSRRPSFRPGLSNLTTPQGPGCPGRIGHIRGMSIYALQRINTYLVRPRDQAPEGGPSEDARAVSRGLRAAVLPLRHHPDRE